MSKDREAEVSRRERDAAYEARLNDDPTIACGHHQCPHNKMQRQYDEYRRRKSEGEGVYGLLKSKQG